MIRLVSLRMVMYLWVSLIIVDMTPPLYLEGEDSIGIQRPYNQPQTCSIVDFLIKI